MKVKKMYDVEGKLFASKEEAQRYEHLCQRTRKVMSILKPRTEQVEKGLSYIKQDITNVQTALELFMEVCGDVIPDYKNIFIQVAEGTRHISHASRIIGDYDYPCLKNAMFRFLCINKETVYEFQQPYFATHLDEAFEDIKKANEYYENNKI